MTKKSDNPDASTTAQAKPGEEVSISASKIGVPSSEGVGDGDGIDSGTGVDVPPEDYDGA